MGRGSDNASRFRLWGLGHGRRCCLSEDGSEGKESQEGSKKDLFHDIT